MMVDGRWVGEFDPRQADGGGGFGRQPSRFRGWVGRDPEMPVAAGRYHLYVAMICPWACRTLMVRKLKGLEGVITVSTLSSEVSDQGWAFDPDNGARDPALGARYLHELYAHTDGGYSGRATVPVLWDKQRRRIVNNESADIVRMLNDSFAAYARSAIDLRPAGLLEQIERLNERIYGGLNNGVYRAGFATTQAAYEAAIADVFACLDELEERLRSRRYLFGDVLTETDVRVFVTLVRFDLAYHGLFKCNRRRLIDYTALPQYVKRIHALPGIAETVDADAIKRGYYSLRALNPSGIVPAGPAQWLPD